MDETERVSELGTGQEWGGQVLQERRTALAKSCKWVMRTSYEGWRVNLV